MCAPHTLLCTSQAPGPLNRMGKNTQLWGGHALQPSEPPRCPCAPTAPEAARQDARPSPIRLQTGTEMPGSLTHSAQLRRGLAEQLAGKGAGVRGWTQSPPFSGGGGGCGAPWQRRPASCAQEIHCTAGEHNWGSTATHSLPRRRYRPARRGWPALPQLCLGLVVLHQPTCIPMAPLLPDGTPPEGAQPWLGPLPNARCLLCAPPSLSARPVPASPGSSAGCRHQSPCFDPILACPCTGLSFISAQGTTSHIRPTRRLQTSPCTLAAVPATGHPQEMSIPGALRA